MQCYGSINQGERGHWTVIFSCTQCSLIFLTLSYPLRPLHKIDAALSPIQRNSASRIRKEKIHWCFLNKAEIIEGLY